MLREKVSKLYDNLVASPRLEIGLASLLLFLASIMVYHPLILLLVYGVLAFIIGFGFCAKPRLHRFLGILFYMSPFVIILLISHILRVEGTVGFAAGVLAMLVLGLCGLQGALLYTLLSTLVTYLYSPFDALAALASCIIAVALVTLVIGREGIDVARAAILAWADDDYRLLEKILGGVYEQVRWKAIGLRDDEGNEIFLVEPGIHYGPFRAAGSSIFPRILLNLSNARAFALHGCGSHERNLVSRLDAETYAKRILEKIMKEASQCNPVKPVKVRGYNGWVSYVFGCEELPALILCNERGVEDFSCDAVATFSEKAMIIDAHNKEASSAPLKGLPETISTALSRLESCPRPMCCWRLVHVDRREAERIGMCDTWILVVKYQCSPGDTVSFVIIPANNVDPEAASRYARRLRGATIVTIDDHSCAALVAGEGVKPLQWDEHLAEVIEQVLESCKPRSCSLYAASGTETLRLWGSATLTRLSLFIERGLRARLIPVALYTLYLIVSLLPLH